ncbi:MAG: hypothetical protein WA702_02615 [Bradyrhizobium sp.]|jgi:hypothetical protein|uniref:hypothetical protein n=1 Tax=Bradyrhizobium sp. TaxID=376 RepID=UPI003C7BEC88
MNWASSMNAVWRDLLVSARALSWGAYVLLAVLLGMLVAVIWLAVSGWSSAPGTDVPAAGYLALAFGVIASMVVGVGLMALVFYSSRAGYDEPARLRDEDHDPNGGSTP